MRTVLVEKTIPTMNNRYTVNVKLSVTKIGDNIIGYHIGYISDNGIESSKSFRKYDNAVKLYNKLGDK